MYVRLADYTLENGTTDWVKYRAAKVQSGEECRKCYRFILMNTGRPTTCNECIEMTTGTDEVYSDQSVRCPSCRHIHNVSNDDLYDLYKEGDHNLSCQACGFNFEVVTSVTYSFKSPAVAGGGDKEEEE